MAVCRQRTNLADTSQLYRHTYGTTDKLKSMDNSSFNKKFLNARRFFKRVGIFCPSDLEILMQIHYKNIILFFHFYIFLNCKIHQYRIEYNNIITYKTSSYNLYSKVQSHLLNVFFFLFKNTLKFLSTLFS